ncbi:unnamed protein product [Diatraea saccharalis]|uniref:Uncharacterized protein n=1 Tax=Diatraea saccharalis TaxID=40085 RepID=A0A9N9RGD2_9NEOP|nr:unnamed protein product [Diatraea saccharalis]
MIITFIVLPLLPVLVTCSGEGNIRLLEAEVATALKTCTLTNDDLKDNNVNQRQRRSENYSRIDLNDTTIALNQYADEKRNSSDMKEQMYILNATENYKGSYNDYNNGEKYVSSIPRPAAGGVYNKTHDNANRTRRNEPLLNKQDTDQVDSRGIPREAEFWNKVQSSVSSQQSRAALRDQTRACFQELQAGHRQRGMSQKEEAKKARVKGRRTGALKEAEDNECSYSNKLERCLMLRFADRKINGTQQVNNRKT